MRPARAPLAALAVVAALAAPGCKKVTHVEISPKQPVLKSRVETVQMIGKVMGGKSHYALEAVSWSSGNDRIATVDASGRVRGVSSGRTTIQANYEGFEAEVPVEVSLVEAIETKDPEVTLSYEAGDPFKPRVEVIGFDGRPLKDRPIFFRTQNEKVCRIDGSGQIWPVDMGETVVTAYQDDREVSMKCVVGK
jgi:cytochrome c556